MRYEMARPLVFVFFLLITGDPSRAGVCDNFGIRSLDGSMQSPVIRQDCVGSGDSCGWIFHSPPGRKNVLFRANFTAKRVTNDNTYRIQMGSGCCWRDDYVNLASVNDKKCIVAYNSQHCLDEVKKMKCIAPDWAYNVERKRLSFMFDCIPDELQFDISYEYIDCLTGRKLKSPTTTAQTTTTERMNNSTIFITQLDRSSEQTTSSYKTITQSEVESPPLSMQMFGIIAGLIGLFFILQIFAMLIYFHCKKKHRRRSVNNHPNDHRVTSVCIPLPSASIYEVVNDLQLPSGAAVEDLDHPSHSRDYSMVSTDQNKPNPIVQPQSHVRPSPKMTSSAQYGSSDHLHYEVPIGASRDALIQEPDYIVPEDLPGGKFDY